MDDIKHIIECLLFVSEDPLPVERIKKVLELPDAKEIKNAITRLMEEYEARHGGLVLREVAGGFQIRTRSEYAPWIKRLVRPGTQRLSGAALETLAIIAYKQPIIRSDVEFIRGVDCGGIIRMLLDKKLIRVLGKKEIPGRPLIYATTKHFLALFELKDLKDLPTPKEIESLGQLSLVEKQALQEDQASDAMTNDGEASGGSPPPIGDPTLENDDEGTAAAKKSGIAVNESSTVIFPVQEEENPASPRTEADEEADNGSEDPEPSG